MTCTRQFSFPVWDHEPEVPNREIRGDAWLPRAILSLLSAVVLLGLTACYQLPPRMAPAPPLGALQNLSPQARHAVAPQWYEANGDLRWPANDGFAAAPVAVVLPSGMQLDRFGSANGRFFSPIGAPYGMRALPYVCAAQVYTVYKVDRPVAVKSGTAAPWFGEPGGAIQYQTGETAAQMLADGTIEKLPDPGPAPCGP